MESIVFNCECGQKIEAPISMSGQLCECPTCNTGLKVPMDKWGWGGIVKKAVLLLWLAFNVFWDYSMWKIGRAAEDIYLPGLIAPSLIWAFAAYANVAP